MWLGPRTAFGLKRDSFQLVNRTILTAFTQETMFKAIFLVAGEIDIRCHYSRHIDRLGEKYRERQIFNFWFEYCTNAFRALKGFPLVIVSPPPPWKT